MMDSRAKPKKIAVIGGTGLIGSAVMGLLESGGHDASSISRSSGADVLTGAGLESALEGVATVIDVSNTEAEDPTEMVNFFTAAAANVLAAERSASVSHHVLLSIIGVDRTREYPHFLGKMAQETTVKDGGIPYTIVRAAQFFEFAESAVKWGLKDGFSDLPPLLMQPVALTDVARLLVELAIGDPTYQTIEIAGPDRHDLIDLARRIRAARGNPPLALVPSWAESGFGTEMAGDVLLPSAGARIASTPFEKWLTSSVNA